MFLAGVNKPLLKGGEMRSGFEIKNSWILIEAGSIKDFGSMTDDSFPGNADKIIDLRPNQYILPGWCDSHTHIVYHQSREREFIDRINGLSYEKIAENGGGILNSAARLRKANFEELFEQAERRLLEVRAMGTGAIEIKSGYGLSTDSEIMMLKVIKSLKEKYVMPIKATFLGAHAFPPEFKENKEGYINLLINEMIPRVSGEGLADYIDVFCDKGFFTVDQTRRILECGHKFGLKAKIHANELANSGGVQIGVEMGAVSVDHLECISEVEIEVLKKSKTIPTGLPGTSFFLNIPYAPVRAMIDAGLPAALATDYNPGSTPSGNMSFLHSLACLKMKLLPIEVISATTLNGAAAMEVGHLAGSLDKGKIANLIITKPIPSIDYLPYSYGSNNIERVMINGEWV